MSCNISNRRGGRIFLHEQNVDEESPIIGVGINNSKLGEAYEDEYQDTLSKNMEDKTRMDDRRCIIVILNYWGEHCSVYYSTGVKIVPHADYFNKKLFYYDGKYKKDSVYAGLNVKFVVKFWMDNKYLKDGFFKLLMDTRK